MILKIDQNSRIWGFENFSLLSSIQGFMICHVDHLLTQFKLKKERESELLKK